jgi:hypothetical protein
MAWGDEGVTKLLYKQDSTTNWGPNNSPTTIQLIKSGILRTLRIVQGGGALAYTGQLVASPMGPYNVYSDLSVLANAQQTVYKASGIGAYYIDAVKRALEYDDGPPNASLPSTISPTDQDYVFDGRAVVPPVTNTQWNWSLKLWISQPIRSLGGDVGLIPMSTENAQLTFSFTQNSASSSSPYTISESTNTMAQPFYGAVGSAPAGALTVASPSVDLVKELFEPIVNAADFPDFSFVNQWVEERPQTFGTNGFTWKQNQDAGVILRLIFGMWASTVSYLNSFGVASASLTGVNAIQLSYNTDIVKFKESALEALARQREQLGFDFDLGVFFYDLLGKDLTLADVLNSYIVPAIQLQMNLNGAFIVSTTVPPKVLVQRLVPIRVQ